MGFRLVPEWKCDVPNCKQSREGDSGSKVPYGWSKVGAKVFCPGHKAEATRLREAVK